MNWAFSQCLLKLKFSARAEATTNAEVERFNGLPSNHSLKQLSCGSQATRYVDTMGPGMQATFIYINFSLYKLV